MTVAADQPGMTRFARVLGLCLVHAPMRAPLPVRFQRAWSELLATSNQIPNEAEPVASELGGVATEMIQAPDSRSGSILYFHGGGYYLGSPRAQRGISVRLAIGSHATAYVPAYRLAPEHPFPAALDDAIAAYRALVERENGAGVVVAGDSAGGGLTVALALSLRDAGLPPPAALVLFCPWLDLAADRSHGPDRDPMLPRVLLARGAHAYLAGHDPLDPRCSPLYGDLADLPPTLVQAAAEDPIRTDAERLAERAGQAGVEVELSRYPLWHDFHLQAGVLRASDDAIAQASRFISSRLANDEPT